MKRGSEEVVICSDLYAAKPYLRYLNDIHLKNKIGYGNFKNTIKEGACEDRIGKWGHDFRKYNAKLRIH